jgi:competence protein ComEC
MLFAKGFWQFYPYLRLALFFVVGILVGYYFAIPSIAYPFGLAIISVLLALVFLRRRYVSTFFIYLSTFFLGATLMMRSASELSRENTSITGNEKEYQAIVVSQPQPRGKTMAMDLYLLREQFKVKAHLYKDDAGKAERLRIGQGIVFYGTIEKPLNQDGKFDYVRWLNTHGFIATVFLLPAEWHTAVLDIRSVSRFQRARWRLLAFRQQLVDRIDASSGGGPSTALLLALTLGDRSYLTQQQKSSFSDAGVAHLLALSGLHLSIVYGFLAFLLSGFRRRWLSTIVCVFSIWIYVMLVGMPVSVVRSALMLSVYSITSVGYRERTGLNVLALTAILLLAFNPLLLWDSGFQFSFLSVFSIGVYFRPLYEIGARWPSLLKKVWGFLIVSIAAQIGTSPLVLYDFGQLNLYVAFTSLVLIPLTMVILYVGFSGLLLLAIGFNSAFLVNLGTKLANLLMTATQWAAQLPGAVVHAEPWSLELTFLTYLLIILLTLLLFKFRQILLGGRVYLN